MRPVRPTAVHKTDRLAELVCSNSFRGDKLDNAVGLLKEEMRRLGSLVMRAAEASRVPAGAALAVDRERFADLITRALTDHPLVTIVREEIASIPSSSDRDPVIVATGPLTSDALSADLASIVGQAHLYFYDAISPIVLAEPIDRDKVFRQSRWDRSFRGAEAPRHAETDMPVAQGFSPAIEAPVAKGFSPACGVDDGQGDYLNCPLTRAEYDSFYDALVAAESATVHDFDKERFFEGCLPIEVMAHRGRDTLRFGPMKPVGLVDPRTRREPYAVVQLRQDNLAGALSLDPNTDQAGRSGARAAAYSWPRARGVRAVRDGPSQHVRERADRTGRDVAGARAADAVVRRSDVGRRRIRGIGFVWAAGRAQCRRAREGRTRVGAAENDRDRCARVLRVARQSRALRTVEHHLRHHAAARPPAARQGRPEDGAGRAGARRSADVDP
jgi:hypothetical protein